MACQEKGPGSSESSKEGLSRSWGRGAPPPLGGDGSKTSKRGMKGEKTWKTSFAVSEGGAKKELGTEGGPWGKNEPKANRGEHLQKKEKRFWKILGELGKTGLIGGGGHKPPD